MNIIICSSSSTARAIYTVFQSIMWWWSSKCSWSYVAWQLYESRTDNHGYVNLIVKSNYETGTIYWTSCQLCWHHAWCFFMSIMPNINCHKWLKPADECDKSYYISLYMLTYHIYYCLLFAVKSFAVSRLYLHSGKSFHSYQLITPCSNTLS